MSNYKQIIFEDDNDTVVKKETLLRKLWDHVFDFYWRWLGGWQIRNFFVSVKNLIRWFPIIWKDRDFDDHYIWEIMKNKLRWQAKYIGDRDFHTRAAMDAKRMRLCVNLIDKVQDEFYSSEYMDYHESKWNFLDIPDKPGFKELDMETTSEHFDDYFKKYPLAYKKVLANKELQIFGIKARDGETEVDVKQRIAMNIGYYNHNRARKLLFKIMEENIEGWWD
jgi:hypothetical protein